MSDFVRGVLPIMLRRMDNLKTLIVEFSEYSEGTKDEAIDGDASWERDGESSEYSQETDDGDEEAMEFWSELADKGKLPVKLEDLLMFSRQFVKGYVSQCHLLSSSI